MIMKKVIFIFTFFLFIFIIFFYKLLYFKQVQEVSSNGLLNEKLELIENCNPINIEEVIKKNKNLDIKEEMFYETSELEYMTQYIENDNLPKGTIHVIQMGITGVQDIITIRRFDGEKLEYEKIVANNVKKASIDKIVEIGTGKRK